MGIESRVKEFENTIAKLSKEGDSIAIYEELYSLKDYMEELEIYVITLENRLGQMNSNYGNIDNNEY